jgi:hypothetical protein
MYQLFSDYGWIIVMTLGLVWFLFARGDADNAPAKIAVFTFIAFIFGVLLTLSATGGIPNVIVAWGAQLPQCNVTLDASRLLRFRKDYDVVAMCGVQDARIDRLRDIRVGISTAYIIRPGVSVWYEAALVPKNTDLSAIRNLSDIPKHGGKVLREGLFSD